MDCKIVYVTFPKEENIKAIAEDLVLRKLAACVNMVDCCSIHSWEGNITSSDEVIMFIKTQHSCIDELVNEIKRLHPYETPAVVVVPIEGGCDDYLAWVATQARGSNV